MPIYEYLCNQCGIGFSRLILNSERTIGIKCRNCNSTDNTRLMSCFAIHETEASRLSRFNTTRPSGEGFYKDERNIGLWAKKRMKETGINLPQVDDFIETCRSNGGKLLDDYYEKQKSDK